MAEIRQVLSISRPYYGGGHRVSGAAIEYDTPIAAESLCLGTYQEDVRIITGIFQADDPAATEPDGGNRFVILNFDLRDEDCTTTKQLHPHPARPRGKNAPKMGGPGGPGGPGPGGPGGPGQGPKGPHGLARKRPPIQLDLMQKLDIVDVNGNVIPAGAEFGVTGEINLLSDRFKVCEFDGKEYNLFVPDNYDPAKKYPLVLFIGDASISGADAAITLEQGVGALCWLNDEIQTSDPCIVLAPSHYDEEPTTNDLYETTAQLDVYKAMCDKVISEYSVDAGRIYTTGQSMGCMSSYELMHRYPDFFTAALCVSGHWDRSKIVDIAKRGQKIWTIMSEGDDKGYVCICEVRDMLDKAGIAYDWFVWNGRKNLDALNADVTASDAAAKTNFRVGIYEGDSALRTGMPDETDNPHFAGWTLTYRLPAAYGWLLAQRK